MNWPMAPADSRENSAARSMSSSPKLAHTASSKAIAPMPLRQPQGEGRAPGGASSARRSPCDSASATNTSARKVSKMLAASPPLSIFIDWSMSWPRPPAPTKPITTEARIAHSQR
ncbi:hypothetical protein D3C85_1653260 [compost metagenome]